MALGIVTLACIAVFVACAFALRARMKRLSQTYELRMQVLAEIEIDAAGLGREVEAAEANERTMRRNETLFRLLWPHEYDRAIYTAQHYIARSNRELALAAARGRDRAAMTAQRAQ